MKNQMCPYCHKEIQSLSKHLWRSSCRIDHQAEILLMHLDWLRQAKASQDPIGVAKMREAVSADIQSLQHMWARI